MLALQLEINILDLGLGAEGEALGYVAHRHDHVLVSLDTLDIFYVRIDQLLVELNILHL